MPAIPTTVREVLSSSYEELRQVALSGVGMGPGTGFGLFVRHGMARWMDACADLFAHPATTPPPLRHAEAQCPITPDVRVEVAMVLTRMALSAAPQGATTC
jgi:hypothetical protein